MAPMRNQSTAIANARRSANNFMEPSSSSSTSAQSSSNMSSTPSTSTSTPTSQSKTGYPLQRGSACLSCRKRKMKCDAGKPVCQQCVKGNRASECEYDDGKSKSRTQMLQEKVSKLQDRIKELETRPSRQSSGSPPSPASSTTQPSSSYPTLAHPHPHTLHNGLDTDIFNTHLPGLSSFPTPGTDIFAPSSSTSSHLDVPYSAHGGMYSSASSSGSASPGPDFGAPASGTLPPPSWGLGTENDGQWWNNEDLTPQWRQTLLDIFLPHRHQSSFFIHVPSLITAVQSNAIPASAKPHPALLNTLYLLATHFAPTPTLSQLEPLFLDRAISHLSSALEHSDRLVNIIQASCLLATWFFGKGRLLEGYYHASSAGRLAIGLGLHQIRSDVFPPQSLMPGGEFEDGILPPPLSKMELGERILAFWEVFNVDRCWAVATGLPSGLTDDDHPRTRILTVWPKEVDDYMDNSHVPFDPHQQQSQRSLRSLYPPFSPSSSPTNSNSDRDSLPAFRAKATALFERASRLSASYESHSHNSHHSSASSSGDKFWSEFRSLQFAINRFLSTLPSIPHRLPPHAGPMNVATQNHQAVRAMLLVTYSLAQVALIQLHHTFAMKDVAAHEKCLEAAAVVIGLIPAMDEGDYAFLDPIMGTCWMCVSDVLIRELLRRSQLPHQSSIDVNANAQQLVVVNRELDTVITAMKCLGTVFPLAGYQVGKVEQGRLEVGY